MHARAGAASSPPAVGKPELNRYAAHTSQALSIFSIAALHRRKATRTTIEGIRERTLMAKLNINGSIRDVEAEPDTPLLWVIREQVGLTGTKYGCGIAQCGACSVHINDEVQRSCSIRVADVSASDRIVTIEGLSSDGSHPVQKAWAALDVPQCGYCQSGQIMAAAALLKRTPKPTDKDIDEAMTNICRCGTYQRIRAAVHMAANATSRT
jgi:isoquinoline 1-oxidoreductase subunit alpha